jgi:CDP-diacylglycerol---glycerol-3-phosphate 3-phosphatidyltransferase
MLKTRAGPEIDRFLRQTFPFVGRIPLHPDVLTIAGTLATLAAGVAFAKSLDRVAGAIMIVAGVLDLMDGMVARSQGTASQAGAFLDSTLDRIGDFFLFSGLGVAMASRGDTSGLLLVFWAMGGSFITSYSRARAEQVLDRLNAGFMERAERFVCLIIGALLGYLTLALWVVAVGATVTSLQRIVVARRRLIAMDLARRAVSDKDR